MNGTICVLGQEITLPVIKNSRPVLAAPFIGGTNLCKEIFLSMRSTPQPKYQFSRAKWHEVHLMFKSYDPIQERLDWCEQTFGPQPNDPDAWSRWYTSHTTLRFRDEKDYHWFILKWGQ